MTITDPNKSATSLQEALDTLVLGPSKIDATALDALVRRFPEHAAILTDFAVEATLDVLTRDDPESGGAAIDTAVSRAMSRFHNRLYIVNRTAEQPLETKSAVVPVNPFDALGRQELRDLGVRIGSNTVFVMKLRDRQVEPATIPERFARTLAKEMGTPLEVLLAHFAGRPTVAAAAHYKADEKPKAGKRQTFEEAVRSSGLSTAQQARLLDL